MSEGITINLTEPKEEITFTLTDQSEEVVFSFSEAARGPQGEPGPGITVDQTIIDGSTNAVSGNAVFDGLALKAPIANPTFTGIVTAPRITGRCDGLEVLCKAGLAINAGQVVYVTGASGNNIIIGLAQANAELTSSKTIGISKSTLATNATGYVITEGLMTVSISAPTANEGDPIWLSPTTAGGMVFGAANKPVAPNHMVYLGVVTRKTGNTIVEIFVKVQNGSELEELADVLITSPTAGQALMRGATLWQNRSLVAADISDSTSAGRSLLTAADAAAQRTSLGLGTAATTNTGTGATNTILGNDARLTDARTPLSHTHGNITNDGKIGSTASLPIITTTAGTLTTGSFGTTAGTFAQGNDSGLVDARAATSAATPSTIVKRGTQGGASFAGTSAIAISANTTIATAVNAVSTNSTAVYGESGSSDGGFFASSTGTGLSTFTNSGDYHAKFGDTSGNNRSFVARVSGAFGWWRGAFRGFLQAPASITTSDKTWTLPNNTGTVALTTDEMTPTAAGIASKINGATAKTTPVDADEIPIADSAASFGLKKLTWANLKSTAQTLFDTLYVGLTGNQTVAGNKTFSGQLELTGQSSTNATSAMTRGLFAEEVMFAMPKIRNSDVAIYTANGGTASLVDGDSLINGTTANARPTALRYRQISRFGGGGNNSVVPLRISTFGCYLGAADTGPKLRCGIGMPITTAIPAANADALTGAGFGWEMYYSTSLTRIVFRLFAHNGTSYVTSAELDTGISILNFDTFLHVIIGLNSSGTVSAWTSFANNPTTILRPSTTATLTLAGGPTSGNFATSGVQWAAVNHSTNAATGNFQLRVLDRKLILD